MPISINGTGSITGLSAGGLPDASVTADDIASNAVTTAKINDAAITYGKLSTSATESDNVAKRTAKAWVNFDGTGVVAIRDDFNVSSITDNGTGEYAVNFSSALANSNYSVCNAGPIAGGSGELGPVTGTRGTGSLQVQGRQQSNPAFLTDMSECHVLIFG